MCPYCSTPMQRDDQFDPICPNGCQECDVIGCTNQMHPQNDANGCVEHELEAALDDLKDNEFDILTQNRVAKWRGLLAGKVAA